MRILLTGAAGFIGSHLAERLLGRGDEVVGLDNFDETLYPAALKQENLSKLRAHAGFRLVQGDLLDERLIDELVGARPEVVVHLAALAGVRPSLREPKRYQRVNIEGTLNVLEACRAHGVRRLVFASSSSVYGAVDDAAQGLPPRAFHEDDPATRPASPYAATKRAGELLCSNYSDLYGIGIASLRFFTVYGPRQRPEMAIHKFTRLIHEGRPVPLFGDGASARDYTYIDDILDGVLGALEHTAVLAEQRDRHRVYNLGGSRTVSLARLVELLEAALGQHAIIERHPDQPGDVPLTFADVSRAASELGYAPRVPIEEGIRRFVAWFRSYRSSANI
ncbi:MAG TPA: NAD-dependent epimerase/dehydratase family protein [Polyangia bacterium]|nr:NAD-dependent epimerase/dehydratase family protein [Polyangia bacterium]